MTFFIPCIGYATQFPFKYIKRPIIYPFHVLYGTEKYTFVSRAGCNKQNSTLTYVLYESLHYYLKNKARRK